MKKLIIIAIIFCTPLCGDILRIRNSTPFKIKFFVSNSGSGMKPIILDKKKRVCIHSDTLIDRTIVAHIAAGSYHDRHAQISTSMALKKDMLQHVSLPAGSHINVTAPRFPKSVGLYAQSITQTHDEHFRCTSIEHGKKFNITFFNMSARNIISLDTTHHHLRLAPRSQACLEFLGPTLVTLSTETSHHIAGNHIEIIPQPIGIIDSAMYKIHVQNPRWNPSMPPDIVLKKSL